MINYIPNIAKINKNERYDAIISVLSDNQIPYEIQPFRINGMEGKNVIVSFDKDLNEKKTVISAHYDNYFGTPGANDNAAACSILLNSILRVSEKGTDKRLEFVFFDLEEDGFLGSKYYLLNLKNDIKTALNLDMCGLGSNIVLSLDNGVENVLELKNLNNVLCLKMLPPEDAYNFIYAKIPTVYIINSTDNDLEFFKAFSVGRMPHVNADFLKTMHKPNDTPDTCNLEQVNKIYDFVNEIID